MSRSGKTRQRGRILHVSYSDLKMFLSCPRLLFWKNNPDVPNPVDYPRLAGIAVHDHVRQTHKPTKDGRPFFFRTKRSMLNAFWARWQRELEYAKSRGLLMDPSENDDEKFLRIAQHCLSNYWDMMQGRIAPVEIEQRYLWNYKPGVKIVGVPDQVHSVSLEWISRKRPELIIDGALHSDYAPVVILDLKTEYPTFDPSEKVASPTDKDWIKTQFELHEYYQPTFYSWLYWMRHGKKPVGFLWYHLRTNRMFFTFRDERDYEELFLAIEHFIDSYNALSFPKNVGRHCGRCDYHVPCHGARPFLKSLPEEIPSAPALLELIAPKVTETDEQLRLRIKVGRRSRKGTLPPDPIQEDLVIRQLPVLPDLPASR